MTIIIPTIGQDPWGATLNGTLAKLSAEEQPDDHGCLAWAYPVSATQATAGFTAGVLHLTKVILRQAATITNVITGMNSGGVGLTAGQNFGALYDSTGTRVGVTADQTANWATAGAKIMPLTAPYVAAAGFYWVAFLSNAATSTPTVPRTANNATTLNNLGTTAATSFSATSGAALTATPASFVPGALTPANTTFFAAVS